MEWTPRPEATVRYYWPINFPCEVRLVLTIWITVNRIPNHGLLKESKVTLRNKPNATTPG